MESSWAPNADNPADPAQVVGQVVEELSSERLGFFASRGEHGERDYIRTLHQTYRLTVGDINRLLSGSTPGGTQILEVGALLGIVSVSLARLGFRVTAQDMPEWLANPALADRYARHGINASAVNLQEGKLPYPAEEFDAVICCEVIEHLNFNPAPVLREFCRVLKPEGLLYITVPNQAWIAKRLRLLAGKSVHDPVSYFTQTEEPGDNSGIHWREYTGAEMRELFEDCGFSVRESRYRHYTAPHHANIARRLAVRALYGLSPSFLPNLVTVGRKRRVASTG